MKKYWHIWVGIGMILLAVLIILGSIFLPRLAAKSDMKEILVKVAASDARYVMLIDPAYRHEGILAGEGREVALTGDTLAQVREGLNALSADFSVDSKQSEESGAFGLHLLVKTATEEIVKIYFTENTFYAILKGNAYHFRADDEEAYSAFYNMLLAAFQ